MISYAQNTTNPPNNGHLAYGYGWIGIIVAAIFFGTTYIPVKKFETGDGMFYQWVFSNAIFLGGCIVNGILVYPKTEPLVIAGGFLWAAGNICVVPIVRLIGLGLGFLLWSSSGLIVGWTISRFGLFGITPELPHNFTLNYIGFTLIAISPFLYSLVKPNVSPEIRSDNSLNENIETRQKFKKKLIGIIMSITAGVLFGILFIPVIYIKDRYPNSSQRDIDYLFAQCSGIYLGSTFFFLIYCIYKRNQPILYPQCILPGLASGTLWFCAFVGFIFGNEALSLSISQPITSSLPGVVSIIITTVVFKEIKGLRNYLLIAVAILTTGVGVILTGLSKMI